MTRWPIVVAAVLVAATARAEIDQNILLPYCTLAALPPPPSASRVEVWFDGICDGTINGVWSVVVVEGQVCTPPGATVGQASRVIKYVNDAPLG